MNQEPSGLDVWWPRLVFVALLGAAAYYLDVVQLVFITGLVVSIMIHEWGHFATARRFGLRADQFFLGFGPTVWSRRVGETEYGVKLLPAGGFVRIKGMHPHDERLAPVPQAMAQRVGAGEDPTAALRALLEERGAGRRLTARLVERFERSVEAGETSELEPSLLALELINSEVPATGRHGDLHHRLLKADEGRFFADAPPWQRAIVLGAGSTLHFVQAIVIVFLGWLLIGPTVAIPEIGELADARLPDGVVVESAAREAGLQVGDRLVAIDGTTTDDFEELRRLVREHPGDPVQLTIERGDPAIEVEISVTPSVYTDPDTGEVVGLLGFIPATEQVPMDADEALYATFVGDGSFTQMLTGTLGQLGNVFGLDGMRNLVEQLGGGERQAEGGISAIGVVSVASDGADRFGVLFLFNLLATVNVFVGVFNALPLPPLDGGHLAVLGVERTVNARRRRQGLPADWSINPTTIASIAIPVIVFIGVISLGLMYLDIFNPVSF